MAFNRTRPLKLESLAEGGGQTDTDVNEVNVGEDYLDAAGLSLQVAGATVNTADATTYISRPVPTQMAFTDGASGTLTLEQLLTSQTGKPGSHASTPDILHWVGPPGDGFASGAFRQTTLSGALPATVTWWTSNAMTQKLFSTSYSYQGVLVASKTHSLYVSGQLFRTLTESFSYAASVFCPTVTRVWS